MSDQPADKSQDAAVSARSRRLVIGTVLYAVVYATVFGLLFVTPRDLADSLGSRFWLAHGVVWLLMSCGLLLLFAGIGFAVAIRLLFRKRPIFSVRSVVIALVILGVCIAWLDSALPKPMRPVNLTAPSDDPPEISN